MLDRQTIIMQMEKKTLSETDEKLWQMKEETRVINTRIAVTPPMMQLKI